MNDIKRTSAKPKKAKTTKATKARGVEAKTKHTTVSRSETVQAEHTPRRRIFRKPALGVVYMALAILVLLATTIIWSYLGARVQNSNADQLSDAYLFTNTSTLHGASFPGQHTFLFKWPLFFVVKQLGFTANSFVYTTIGLTVLTVGLFALLLYRIERRPYIFGSICLLLASVLLAIPALASAGTLLPVNMAMLTTRNLEYIVYLIALILFIRAPRIKSAQFWMGIVVMSLLMASDKLFLDIGIGAAVVSLFVYALMKRTPLVTFSAVLALGELIAAAIAAAGVQIIDSTGFTHIISSGATGPYAVSSGTHSILVGGIYTVLGLLTNLGANPAFDAFELRQIPHEAIHRLLSWGGVTFICNILVVCLVVFAVYRVVRTSLLDHSGDVEIDRPKQLSLIMIWSVLVACGAYIASSHYYAADSRYLAIALFGAFIVLATAVRQYNPSRVAILITACFATIAILGGVFVSVRNYHDETQALSGMNGKNGQIVSILSQHKVSTLLGDYWRVMPIRLVSHSAIAVTPLTNCTQQRTVLSSQSSQPLSKTTASFAYLLSFDKSVSDFPMCMLNQVVTSFGRPNASALIAGTLPNPSEELLFYDHGAHLSAPKITASVSAPETVTPVNISQIPNASCSGPSAMNIVAHEDDDVLFMNPDIINDLKQGMCERTVYITAGDAGSGAFYWLGRQQGAEAAYSSELGTSAIWVQRIVKLPGGQYVVIANPSGDKNHSLIFMNVPDGNMKGNGFAATGFESLTRLYTGQIKTITTVDKQSSYTALQLESALTTLMQTYQPSEIRTQANYVSKVYPDHSDHMTVGNFVKVAYQNYEVEQYQNQVIIPLKFYVGYPIHAMLANVSDGDLTMKTAAFYAYAQHDPAVCATNNPCKLAPVLTTYLAREYQNSY